MCERRGYCSERNIGEDIAEDVNASQGGNCFKSPWFNFRAFHDAGKPHKASDETTNAKLDGCAGHWVGKGLEYLFVIAAGEGNNN